MTLAFLIVDVVFAPKFNLPVRVLCALDTIIIWIKALSYSRAFEDTVFITDILLIICTSKKLLLFFLNMFWIMMGFGIACISNISLFLFY